MRNRLQRILALALGMLLLASTFSVLAVNVGAEEKDESLIKGDFVYAPHTYLDGDLMDIYYYSDEFFSGSALDYNEHLATASMILAAASISSQDPDATYETKSRNLSHLMREWDFVGFEVNEYYRTRPDLDTMGVAIGRKVIGEGEDAFTLLAVVPRSAGYEREWAGNFTVGTEGHHEGFAEGRDIILDFLEEYVAEYKDRFEGEVKLWTVGYSRGAGVANLLAAYLVDNSADVGLELKQENIFAYTFGTPANVQYADEAEKAALENNYRNIHNRYSEYDIVTYAPFKNWNFTYYGTTRLFDVHNAEKKAEMLTFLEKTNKTVFDLYTAENSSANPDNFLPLMLQVDPQTGVSFVPAKAEYGIPANQKDFLDSRIDFLVNKLVPDRESYVADGYELALQQLTYLYFGLNAEQSAQLIEGMSHDLPTLAAAYYCYYLVDFYLDTDMGTTAVAALIQSLPMIEEYVLALENDETVSTQEWYIYAKTCLESADYATLKEVLQIIGSDEAILRENMPLITSSIETFAVGMTSRILGSGITAVTMGESEEEQEEKEELLSIMTSEDVCRPLTRFLVYLLLGTEEETVDAFDPSNKNIAMAVTFLGNAGRYMRVHNNEIILSWLRTEDSYYADENWHVHVMDVKFDENGHWEECECGHAEGACDHVLSDWALLPVEEGEVEMEIRRCPCGYEEVRESPVEENRFLAVLPIIACAVGGILVIGGAIVAVIVVKKRKSRK